MGKAIALTVTASLVFAISSVPANGSTSERSQSNKDFLAKNYPPESLKHGEYGKVGFQLTVEPDGMLSACSITESSGFARLDSGTCDLLVRTARLQPARDKDGRSVRTTSTGYVNWTLPPNIARAVPSANVKVDDLFCKKTEASGSNVRTITRCMTEAQWKLHYRITQTAIQRLQNEATCSDHGC